MKDLVKTRIRVTTIITWSLLVYIIAALVWWYISLLHQSNQMHDYKLHQLELSIQKDKTPELYKDALGKIETEARTNQIKYTGEGVVFLGILLIGAFFVIRSVRQQIKMQAQQQNFMMAVTHELKTPIAIAKLNLETLLKHQLDPTKQRKLINMTVEELGRLNFLTNNILVSSQLENISHTINKEELDFSSLVKDRVKEFAARYPDRQFITSIEDDNEISGDSLLLQILINNLLENAVKYADKNVPVTITLQEGGGTVVLRVIDEGPGIPEAERTNIFKKFYRVGNEATRRKQGSGLGLYLCKQIAKDHDADISMTNNTPAGSIFAVRFNVSK